MRDLGQPVTLTGVFCLISRPFEALNRVGMRSFRPQKFWLPLGRLTPNSLYLPAGRLTSIDSNGTSGVLRNVALVTPALLMKYRRSGRR